MLRAKRNMLSLYKFSQKRRNWVSICRSICWGLNEWRDVSTIKSIMKRREQIKKTQTQEAEVTLCQYLCFKVRVKSRCHAILWWVIMSDDEVQWVPAWLCQLVSLSTVLFLNLKTARRFNKFDQSTHSLKVSFSCKSSVKPLSIQMSKHLKVDNYC